MDLVFKLSGRPVLLQRLHSKRSFLIGRSPECDIQLVGPDVSRVHCEIKSSNKAWVIKNLSSGSTRVNGNKVEDETLLTPGDVITIGSWSVHADRKKSSHAEDTSDMSIHSTKKVTGLGEEAEELPAPRISIVLPPDPPHKFTLNREITIGQHPDCCLKISDPYVSRWHCTLSWNGQELTIRDLGSTNGTFIGGQKIARSVLGSSGEFVAGKTPIKYKIDKCDSSGPSDGIVGNSEAWQSVMAKLGQVAPLDASVCLQGQSGTGKEVAARYIHEHSLRKNRPFVAVNCGAIPATLIEGMLFGHERGAFTGATESSTGLFEQADGGTLFLDEIGELSVDLQTRLLRILETGVIRKLGAKSEKQVKFRLIAATNKDLCHEVALGKFREDLFHRIFVFPINLPALKDRGDDVVLLADHFISEFSPTGLHQLTAKAHKKLKAYAWPGNVRELKNTIQRTLISCTSSKIDADALAIYPMPHKQVSASADCGKMLEDNEKAVLTEIFTKCEGNISAAAKRLGIARSTLRTKLKKYGL